MGCRSSKNSQVIPPITHAFHPTANGDIDDFFSRADLLLERIESIRYQMYDTKQKGIRLSGTTLAADSPYTRAVQVLFWALAGSSKGILASTGLIIQEKAPFISANADNAPKEVQELLKTLQEYLAILLETPESIHSLVDKLQSIRDDQIRLMNNNEYNTSAKSKKVYNDNMRKLSEDIAVSATVLSQVPDEQTNAYELIQYMRQIQFTSDEIGLKAYHAGLSKPLEIYRWIEMEEKKEDQKS